MKRFVNWWEKTVEYAFVLNHMGELAKAVPLDGNPEQWWGDLITEEEGEFTLIEFKRDVDAIDDEFDKYSSLAPCEGIGRNHVELIRQRAPGLLRMDGAKSHVFILGVEDEETLTMELKLAWYMDPGRTLVDIPTRTRMPKVRTELFVPYALALRDIRKSVTQSASSGGMVCATKQGKLTAAIDLATFQSIALQREKSLIQNLTQEPSPSPTRAIKRSRGMELG